MLRAISQYVAIKMMELIVNSCLFECLNPFASDLLLSRSLDCPDYSAYNNLYIRESHSSLLSHTIDSPARYLIDKYISFLYRVWAKNIEKYLAEPVWSILLTYVSKLCIWNSMLVKDKRDSRFVLKTRYWSYEQFAFT